VRAYHPQVGWAWGARSWIHARLILREPLFSDNSSRASSFACLGSDRAKSHSTGAGGTFQRSSVRSTRAASGPGARSGGDAASALSWIRRRTKPDVSAARCAISLALKLRRTWPVWGRQRALRLGTDRPPVAVQEAGAGHGAQPRLRRLEDVRRLAQGESLIRLWLRASDPCASPHRTALWRRC